MNKYLLFFILGANISLSAQKRTNYLGGTVMFNRSSDETMRESDEPRKDITKDNSIAPEIQWGYYINNSTVVGIGLKYTFFWTQNTANDLSIKSARNQALEFMPFIRRYKMIGNRWAMFLHAEVGPKYNWDKSYSTGTESYETKYEFWHYNLSVRPGVVYFFPNKKWALEGYANIASLGATFIPVTSHNPRQIFINSSFQNPKSSIYFSLRLVRYFSPKTI